MNVDLFVSYAHEDDRPSGRDEPGWITSFLAALHAQHRRITTTDLSMFFDHEAIRVAEDWDLRIRESLRASSVLLAFVSPGYFASEWCRREWDLYVGHESERALSGEGILPLYLVGVEGHEEGAAARHAPGWSQDLMRRQWLDLRRWRDEGHRAFEGRDISAGIELLDQKISIVLDRARRAMAAPGTVDRSNSSFVGRAKELRRLRRLLAADAPTGAIVAVHGLGGLGKTALVTQYAHQFAAEYPGGRWTLRCEGQHDLATVVMQLASPLEIEFSHDERRDSTQALNRVMAELERRTMAAAPASSHGAACLLLLDNVDQPGLVSPSQTARLPQKPWLHLVMTTRLGADQLYEGEADRGFLALDEIPVPDAVQLIERHQPGQCFPSPSERVAAEAIARRLGGWPLAVEAVAVFLGLNPEVSCAAFRQRLDEEGLDASEALVDSADVSNRIRHREKQLGAVFAPMVAQLDSAERFALDVASVLPADFVPIAWLHEWVAVRFPERTSSKPGYADPWAQSVRRLIGRRLWIPIGDAETSGSPRMVRMHRLLQEWIAKREGFPRQELTALVLKHAESRREAVSRGWAEPGIRWEVEPLAAVAAQHLAANDPGIITFASRMASLLQQQARFPQAEHLLSAAIAVEEANSDGRSSDLGMLLGNLGSLLMATARYAEAEPPLRRALAIDEALFGVDDLKVGTDCNNLGGLLYLTGRFDEATAWYQRAVSVYEKVNGPESLEVATTLNNIGQLLQNQVRLEEAEAAMRRVVDIQAKHYDRNDVRLAVGLLNLGRLLHFRHKPDEAEPLVRRAIALEEAFYGPEHPGLATNFMYLAEIIGQRGERDEAESLLRRALPLVETAYGPNHPTIARICTSLGNALAEREEWVESEAMARRAIAISEAISGEYAASTLSAARLLTVVLMATQRFEEAVPFAQSGVIGALKFTVENGRLHPDLGYLHNTYAELLRHGNDEAAVNAHLQEIFASFGISLQSEQPQKRPRAKSKGGRPRPPSRR